MPSIPRLLLCGKVSVAELRANFMTSEPSLLTAIAQMRSAAKLLPLQHLSLEGEGFCLLPSCCGILCGDVALHSPGWCLPSHTWVISHDVCAVLNWLKLHPPLTLLSPQDPTDNFLDVRRRVACVTFRLLYRRLVVPGHPLSWGGRVEQC